MSTTSSWDQLKKVREEEYFYKDERDKVAALKAEREQSRAFMEVTKEKMKDFERGFSPISGKNMFRANVDGDIVLDCPEEGTLTMTYDTLEAIIKAARKGEDAHITKWAQYLEVAIDSHVDAPPEENDEEVAE